MFKSKRANMEPKTPCVLNSLKSLTNHYDSVNCCKNEMQMLDFLWVEWCSRLPDRCCAGQRKSL